MIRRIKKNWIAVVLLGVLITPLAACGNANDGEGKVLDFKVESVYQDYGNDLLRFSAGASSTYTVDDITLNLKEYLNTLDKENQEKSIELYINGLSLSHENLSAKLEIIGFELEEMITEHKLESPTVENINTAKVSDEYGMVTGFIKEVEHNGFRLIKNESSGYYEIELNMLPIVEKYGSYMNESYKNYLIFIEKQISEPIVTGDKLDITKISSKIVELEKSIATDKNNSYKYIDKWMGAYQHFYTILFGLSHDEFTASEFYKEDTITKYKEIVEKHKGTELAENISKALEVLEKNNKASNEAVKKELNDIIQAKYILNNSEIGNAVKAIVNTQAESLEGLGDIAEEAINNAKSPDKNEAQIEGEATTPTE